MPSTEITALWMQKKQTWNGTRNLLNFPGYYLEWIRTQSTTTGKERIGILTNCENQMEQSKLDTRDLINIQVTIDFFVLKEKSPSVKEVDPEANP